jgi:amidase
MSEPRMSTWIERCEPGPGIRVAVKDLVDVAGLPTTAGCAAVAERAVPAESDAACLAGVRAACEEGLASIAGKANLHELAFGVTGINPWFGTPRNPADARRVPGGSSSGSAAAVGAGEADVAIGTDTGGSVRIPAACCAVVGLKTTWGRIPVDGVRPLAPSLDTVGPLARDVTMLVEAMRLLEPGFTEDARWVPESVGRIILPATERVDRAIDDALAAAELRVSTVELPSWRDVTLAGLVRLGAEAWAADGELVSTGRVGDDVVQRLRAGAATTAAQLAEADAVCDAWRRELAMLFERVEVLALPTLVSEPPLLEDAANMAKVRATVPVNVAGAPALALPVPVRGGGFPASLQLVGPLGSEERLVALGRRVEAALAP